MQNEKLQNENTKKSNPLHPMALLFYLIIITALLTLVIPSGQFERVQVGGRTVVDPDSFQFIEKTFLTPMEFVTALPRGMNAVAGFIFLVLLNGACVYLVGSTKAVSGAVSAFSKKFGDDRSHWILIAQFLFFSVLGAYAGMLTVIVSFMPLTVLVALMLRYDAIVGIAVGLVGIVVGFTAGPVNVFTTGVGHDLAGLVMFSGFWYRNLAWLVMISISLPYILYYAAKVRRDPTASVIYGLEGPLTLESMGSDAEHVDFTTTHKVILCVFGATIGLVAFGSLNWGWATLEIGAVYFHSGLLMGLIAGFRPSELADKVIKGMIVVFPAAMAAGVARTIGILMERTLIIDTVIFGLANPLREVYTGFVSAGMLVVQTLINFVIPASIAQALAVFPIVLPLSQMLGIPQQVAILAFQFGDGISNFIFPTVPFVIGCLMYAKVPFTRWLRFAMPLVILLWIAAIIMLYYATFIGWGLDHYIVPEAAEYAANANG